MSMDNLHYYRPSESKRHKEIVTVDLLVYGATPAGITAAIQASEMGLSVSIAEFSGHIGGITTSGLGATDLGAKEAVGGLSREFYRRIGSYYVKEEQWTFEPKAARYVFEQWMKEYDIDVYHHQHLQEAVMHEGKIDSLVMESGNRYRASYFVDASYEGDLMAKAGVSYFVGREPNATYNETYNGIQFGHPHHRFEREIDPFIIPGDPGSGCLPGITEILERQEEQGEGDKRIQAYNFRICLTNREENKAAFPKPADYDPEKYELLLRYLQSGVWDAMKLHIELPNGKTDLNNHGAVSTDYIGMNHGWPEGSYALREKIYQEHLTYNAGMLYFLANDSRVPEKVREDVAAWGLPLDEFADTGNWPPQLYIRESRRMISDYVMTDNNCLGKTIAEDSIGLASYQMDSHHVRRVAMDGKCINEGDVEIPISPYPISYQSIRPKAEECSNLLIPVCLSSSHIAYGSIRMEPVFMILGQAAGAAAALALKHQSAVQQVDYEELREVLLDAGQVLEWDESIKDDPEERMKATFGKP